MTLTFTACTSSTAAASGRDGSAIPATDVLNLEMFNARSGVAVVFSPLPPACKHNCTAGVPARFRDYLATADRPGGPRASFPPTSTPERLTRCNWRFGTRTMVTCRALTRLRLCSLTMPGERGRRCGHPAGRRPSRSQARHYGSSRSSAQRHCYRQMGYARAGSSLTRSDT
jgi:hypothetical protein